MHIGDGAAIGGYKLKFDRRYFETEIRDGFLVPSTIKHAWAAQLEILQDLDALCKKHQIQYFADWGTMLGTVRHHGYIPWDDDLDIAMKREDYMRFLEIAKTELPSRYHLVNFYNENGFTDYLTRIVNSFAINYEPEFLEKYHQFPYVCGIDIFVMDYRSQDEEKDREQVQVIKETAGYIEQLQKLLKATGKDPKSADLELRNKKDNYYLLAKEYEELLQEKYSIPVPENLPLIRKLYIVSDGIMALYSDTKKYPNPKRITIMALWVENSYDLPAEYYEEFVEMPYENFKMPVPLHYDEILRKKYGNYWNLVRKGSSHEYPYYEKQEKVVWEKLKTTGEWCSFTESVLEEREKKRRRSFRENVTEYYGVLQQFMQLIVKLAGEGNYALLQQILPKGQELAVQLGTFLETSIWSGYKQENRFVLNTAQKESCEEMVRTAVGELEKYCELLYEINNCLCGQDDTGMQQIAGQTAAIGQPFTLQQRLEQILSAMLCCLMEVRKETEKLFAVKRVLFVLRTLEDMKCCRRVAERYRDKEDYLLQFLFAATYEKLPDGTRSDAYIESVESIKNGENGECRGDIKLPKQTEWPEFLNSEVYNPYEQLPDEIYVFNPYDNCNPDYTVDIKYYAGNLLECTPKLVYVPSLTPLDFEIDEERSVKNLKYYVPMPAPSYADQVVVTTDCIRERYIECLTEWSGEKWQPAWEEKLCSMESWTGWKENLTRENSEKESSKRKLLAFYVSTVSFWVKGGCAEKVLDCFRIFQNYHDKIEILWVKDEDVSYAGQQWEPLETEFQKLQLGSICTEAELLKRLEEVDAYYGEAGNLSTKMVVMKKPAMIMDFECRG